MKDTLKVGAGIAAGVLMVVTVQATYRNLPISGEAYGKVLSYAKSRRLNVGEASSLIVNTSPIFPFEGNYYSIPINDGEGNLVLTCWMDEQGYADYRNTQDIPTDKCLFPKKIFTGYIRPIDYETLSCDLKLPVLEDEINSNLRWVNQEQNK